MGEDGGREGGKTIFSKTRTVRKTNDRGDGKERGGDSVPNKPRGGEILNTVGRGAKMGLGGRGSGGRQRGRGGGRYIRGTPPLYVIRNM